MAALALRLHRLPVLAQRAHNLCHCVAIDHVLLRHRPKARRARFVLRLIVAEAAGKDDAAARRDYLAPPSVVPAAVAKRGGRAQGLKMLSVHYEDRLRILRLPRVVPFIRIVRVRRVIAAIYRVVALERSIAPDRNDVVAIVVVAAAANSGRRLSCGDRRRRRCALDDAVHDGSDAPLVSAAVDRDLHCRRCGGDSGYFIEQLLRFQACLLLCERLLLERLNLHGFIRDDIAEGRRLGGLLELELEQVAIQHRSHDRHLSIQVLARHLAFLFGPRVAQHQHALANGDSEGVVHARQAHGHRRLRRRKRTSRAATFCICAAQRVPTARHAAPRAAATAARSALRRRRLMRRRLPARRERRELRLQLRAALHQRDNIPPPLLHGRKVDRRRQLRHCLAQLWRCRPAHGEVHATYYTSLWSF
jgi:hypothetical protein